jgi:3-deoxy-D-manno-octulosonic-acid transferase
VNSVLFNLYRITGALIHGLLVLTAPLLKLVAPDWAIESRLGRMTSLDRPESKVLVWIHAASVGEVQAARALVHGLEKRHKGCSFFLTTMTRLGLKVAEGRLPAEVECQLAPLDTPQAVEKTIHNIKPDLYICLETELWPMMLSLLKQAGIPMLLLNGRMSERSCRRYQKIGKIMEHLLNGFAGIGVIQEHDAARYQSLGASSDRVRVCGNMKYDLPVKDPLLLQQKYRQLLHLDQKTVFICGSTRSGEEKLLLPVYDRVKKHTKGKLVWIIAPRHVERLKEVQDLLQKNGLVFDLFSQCKKQGRKQDIILVDVIGELAELYAVGDYNFCGGSLVEQGGHNIMEPVRLGKAVYFGPFMKDFSDAAVLVLSGGAGFQVQNAEELADCLELHIKNPELYNRAGRNAEQLAIKQQGAVDRQVDMVMKLLAA